MNALPSLATIGYEAATLDAVLEALLTSGVTRLVDVRAVPQSRRAGFSKRVLSASLEARGIAYTHIRSLGTPKAGRDAARRGDIATMTHIFDAHMHLDEAQAGLAQATAIARAERTCLLCFERDHAGCHRHIVAALIHSETKQAVVHLRAERP